MVLLNLLQAPYIPGASSNPSAVRVWRDFLREAWLAGQVRMSKRKSEQGTANDVKELFAAMGMKEPCPLCSSPNWDIYHPPEKPCPKQVNAQQHGAVE